GNPYPIGRAGRIAHPQDDRHVSARLHSVWNPDIHLHQSGNLTLYAARILNWRRDPADGDRDPKERSRRRRTTDLAIRSTWRRLPLARTEERDVVANLRWISSRVDSPVRVDNSRLSPTLLIRREQAWRGERHRDREVIGHLAL